MSVDSIATGDCEPRRTRAEPPSRALGPCTVIVVGGARIGLICAVAWEWRSALPGRGGFSRLVVDDD
jgi:hypothetical protein